MHIWNLLVSLCFMQIEKIFNRGSGAPTNGSRRKWKKRRCESPHDNDDKEDGEQHPLNESGPHDNDNKEDEEQHPLNESGPHDNDDKEDEEQHPLNESGPHDNDDKEDEEQHPLKESRPHDNDNKEDEEQHPLNESGPHDNDNKEDEEQHPLNESGPECQKKLFEDEDMVIDDSFHGSYGYNSEDEMSPLYPLDSSLLSESSFLTALASELMEVPDKDGIEVVKNTHAFKIGDFLLVEFDLVKSSKKRKYIAEILELAKGEDDEPLYKVKCLKRVEEISLIGQKYLTYVI
ncbi:RNA polymerase-associated protein LEO1-like [Mytilus californianus]|uniref:RNA polymerase-associated protein LEO1-like n=1 Tax=Mytilus californianus TaxID=6549 RepID=UPI002246A021|nr:RNA polymerase-associated protein LEO1-like [Mytilus californianus]